MLKLFIKYGKGLFWLAIFISVFSGLMLPINAMLIQNIIDTVTNSNSATFLSNSSIIWIILLLLSMLLNVLLEEIRKYICILFRNRLEINWGKDIYLKSIKIDYIYYEKEETYIIIDRLISNFKKNAIDSTDMVFTLVSLVISLGGILLYIFQAGWNVMFLLLVTSIPIWTLSVLAIIKEKDTWQEAYPYLLKSKYLSNIISSREFIKESHLYTYNNYISKLWRSNLHKFQKSVFMSNLKERNITALFIVLQYSLITYVIFCLLIPLQKNLISTGFLISVSQILWNFVGNLQYKIISIIQKINSLQYFKMDYDKFLSYKSSSYKLPNSYNDSKEIELESIIFKDVWFRYNEDEDFILKNINLKIIKGSNIAIVGKNGCGKTTLIKLLLGILYPSKGQVLINNQDTKTMDNIYRKKLMSVIFQDFAKYNLTLKENISVSNLSIMESETEISEILERLCNKNTFMKNMDSGLNTLIGKNIDDGIDISGGQWQTIGIARALFARTPLLIMDEPTASLDPMAELIVYKQLMEATKDKTVIYITHRLGATKFADIIYTLDLGEIIEEGSHNQLMQKGGIYAEMFNIQMQWYK